MPTYTWAVQRLHHGHWSHQAILGGPPPDPRGHETSGEDPYEFAHTIAQRINPEGHWRVAVWDTVGVGRPPVAVLEGGAQ